MSLSTIATFLFGHRQAIQDVAANRSALWTSLVLVLLTGIARNYDQNYLLETPFWLIGPLLFSLISGSFLYGVLIRGFARRHFPEGVERRKEWLTFMALFWMTAPTAWLYAIPVERFLDSYHAAESNIVLLALVSAWRVALMSRILVVLLEIPFWRALGWVLVAASLEIIVVVALGVLFGGAGGRHILASMAGMRNAPEETLLMSVLGNVWAWSWAVLILSAVLLASRPFRGEARPLPIPSPGRIPWLPLTIVVITWIAVAIPAQNEQRRFFHHARLIEKGDYSRALAFLTQHQPADFPPSRRLEPDPYELTVWERLPGTVALLSSNTPTWIRRLYLSHLKVTLSHYYSRYPSYTNVAPMISTLAQLPEGPEWLLANQDRIARQGLGPGYLRTDADETAELNAHSNILATLTRIGFSETNLAHLRPMTPALISPEPQSVGLTNKP